MPWLVPLNYMSFRRQTRFGNRCAVGYLQFATNWVKAKRCWLHARRSPATEATLHEWHGRQTDAELESRSLKGRIVDTEKRLMDGSVTNPKELEALQASLDALKRQQTSVDEKSRRGAASGGGTDQFAVGAASTLGRAGRSVALISERTLEAEEKMKRNYIILRRRREKAAATMDPG